MKSVAIYLNFQGNTEEAFNFYKSVFGTEFTGVYRFKDTPAKDQMPADVQDGIMHIALPITKEVSLFGTDAIESMGQHLNMGNNVYVYLEVDSEAEADDLFKKLSEGGKVEMAPAKQFWGSYYSAFADKFGLQWMISYTYPEAKF